MAQLQQNNSNTNISHLSEIKQSVEQPIEQSFDQSFEQSIIKLRQIVTDMKSLTKDTELTLKTEAFDLTKIQNNLLKLKYDLIKQECLTLTSANLIMRDKLEAYTCSICLTNLKDCILEPCGHFVCCMRCIKLLSDAKCPICRTTCNYYNRVFNS